MKLIEVYLKNEILEQNFEKYDDYDDVRKDTKPKSNPDFMEGDVSEIKFKKEKSLEVKKGDGFHSVLEWKDGFVKELPQNFVHNLKETYSDISMEFDDFAKTNNVTLLPGTASLYSYIDLSEDGMGEDKFCYVVSFHGKKEGKEWVYSISIPEEWSPFKLFAWSHERFDEELGRKGDEMFDNEQLSRTSESTKRLEKEIRDVINSREQK